MSLSVKYYDVPTLATGLIQTEATGIQSFSSPYTALAGLRGVPIASPEPGSWPLDGSCQLMQDPPSRYLWSAYRSDSTGVLAQPVVLTLRTPTPVTATGLTFTFWPATNQWCSHVRLRWYCGSTLLRQSDGYPDAPHWTLAQTVEGFDSLQVELLATNKPGQFAKLEKLELGQVWTFAEKDLISVRLVNEMDPLLSELTVDTMQIKLHNPAETPLLPMENQRLVLCREDEPVATHYITGSSRESRNMYTLQTQSAIGLLEDTFLGGMYDRASVSELVMQICNGYAFSVDPDYQQALISGYLPVCTCREALQQLAFAIGAAVYTSEDGTIQVRPVSMDTEDGFYEEEIFHGAKVTTRARYSRVSVAAHTYTEDPDERLLLDAEQINGTNVLITFQQPHYGYHISGGTLLESGANYIRISAQGPVSVSAKGYIHTTQVHSKTDPKATDAEYRNVLQVDGATLVTSENAQAVLEQLYDTAQLRQLVEMDAVINQQKAGQRITVCTPWGGYAEGYIAAMESRLTSKGQVASVRLIGQEV